MKRQLTRRRIGVATALVALAIAAWEGAIRPHEARADTASTAPSAAAPSGPTSVVRRGTLNLSIDMDGTFEPVNAFEVRLQFRRYSGDLQVRTIVAPGKKVTKGASLLELDTKPIDAQIADARNGVEIADANLAKAQSDVTLGDQSDALAMTNAKIAAGNAHQDEARWSKADADAFLQTAQLHLKEAQAQLEDSTDELVQLRKMYKTEDLTGATEDIVMKRAARELELQKTNVAVAQTTEDRAEHLDAAVHQDQLAAASANTDLAVAQLIPTQALGKTLRHSAVVTAQLADDEAHRRMDDLTADRAALTVTSPIDGVVVFGEFAHSAWTATDPDRMAPGQKVAADQVLLTVYTPGHLRLRAFCPEAQISYLADDDKLTITPDAKPDLSYTGICHSISVIGQPHGSGQAFDLVLDLPSVDAGLAPGFKAEVNFDAGHIDDALLVPISAVWRGKVWMTQPTEQPKVVVVGASDGQDIQITSGLKEGDVVLTQAKHPGE